ncbi:hypothetical protein LPJ66_007974 [Kickxella alabastrina]|uniref:Uncharacterized protein n=1 Tax=Kickxella alabastrina TaxID=61397 RepID=A0ACC1IFM6_9FUNG|nr:hypothetical protein LPJ66_007974 [Kickxella alabastrina]
MKLARILFAPAFLGVMVTAMNLLNKDVTESEISQVPTTLDALLSNDAGKLTLNRRITSVRPGDLARVSFNIPSDKLDTPNFSEIIAAVYSTKDGSLVRVLNKAPAMQVDGLRDAQFRGGRDITLHLPVSGLPNKKEFVMYKLALIAPERETTGLWTRYSADTMLFAYDGAN